MKLRQLLINASRGGLVNEADLVRALDEGLIAGAGFDCLTSETAGRRSPVLADRRAPNVIVTPHVAWASDEAMQAVSDQVIGNIESFQRGTPSYVV
jgi:glycerate dehydrogenase